MIKTSLKQKQSFFFSAPWAKSVQLVGDFTQWRQKPISLKKQSNGIWKTTLELVPGTYQYRFLVDGEWRDDSECTCRLSNPFGSTNSVREVPQTLVADEFDMGKQIERTDGRGFSGQQEKFRHASPS